MQHYGLDVPEQPEIPEGTWHIWPIWNRLRARTPAGDSVSPITYQGIEAFIRLTGEPVNSDDIEMLEALDDAFVSQISTERSEMQERQREEAEARRNR